MARSLVVALLSLATACTKTVTMTTAAPSSTVAPTTTSTLPAGPGVTVKVTGTGTAASVTILDDGQQSQQQGVALPYTEILPGDPSVVGITAHGGDATATISCEVDRPGKPPVTGTASGPYSVVTCNSTT